ncbi:hypothetical protein [Hyphomicrobium sp.]|uniref:hypothetical protein n=1 Tax=Hyphomicrobium sp. TaxID=82 RepID=UPI002E372C59|nr:hypothetical protein [Hyphomicrobium sp.]HEX2842161.1 hypothetical protein [Hyphomicrobium sp.]
MTLTVHQQMLAHMSDMRTALGLRFMWFIHVTLKDNLPGILLEGLQPKTDMAAPDEVVAALGYGASSIICLTPLGTQRVCPPVKEGKKACLAFFRDDLPERLGLDWSFSYMTNFAEERSSPHRPIEDIFLELVIQNGTFVSYDSIPPQHLRLFVNGVAPHDVEKWPMLSPQSIEQAYTFP